MKLLRASSAAAAAAARCEDQKELAARIGAIEEQFENMISADHDGTMLGDGMPYDAVEWAPPEEQELD
ncbi:MAG: hypothetical protein IT371_14340 [Deltaproteobacteria bacterium]|nr:hypothetical protein [Deltaproteobacteria bacterium]